MNAKDVMPLKDQLTVGAGMKTNIQDNFGDGAAILFVTHMRPKDWKKNPKTGLMEPDYRWVDDPIFGKKGTVDRDSCEVLDEQEIHNLILNVGRVFVHTQAYATSGIGANGLNYVALTNDATAPAATDTTLLSEITTNGLARVQGTVVLPTGSGNVTTISHTFTASASQSAQKGALFSASSGGTMNHEALFTQRNLLTGDTLGVTFTITLG